MNKVKPATEKCAKKYDLANDLRSLLTLGRWIGLIPIVGVTSGRTEYLKFRWRHIATITSLTCCVLIAVNTVLGATLFLKYTARSALGLATTGSYCILYANSLIGTSLNFYREDKKLTRDCKLVAGIVFGSVTLEMAVGYLLHGLNADVTIAGLNAQNISITIGEYYYQKATLLVSTVVPYNPVLFVHLFITRIVGMFANEFGDVFIIVLSRAMYVKFKVLTAEVAMALRRYEQNETEVGTLWKHFLEDSKKLLVLLSLLERFLSPFIFLAAWQNVYLLSLRLCWTWSQQPPESATFIDQTYANWAFFHCVARNYFVLLSTAKVNEHVSKISSFMREIPADTIYSGELKRFQYHLRHQQLGLTGLGCFTVTKGFMLKFAGVIFTVVIFLFQSPYVY